MTAAPLHNLPEELPRCHCSAPAILGHTEHDPRWCREHMDEAAETARSGERLRLCPWWRSVIDVK